MKRFLSALPLLLLALLAAAGPAQARCYVQFDSTANKVMHMNGDVQRGNFASMADCERYQASRPAFERNHSWCAGTCGGGGSGYSGGGYTSSNPMVNLFGAVLQSFIKAALSDSPGSGSSNAAPQKQGPTAEELAAQKRAQELWAKAQEQMKELEQEYKNERAKSFAQSNAGLSQSLKDRFQSSYGSAAGGAVTPAANGACWSKLAAGTKNAELARKYSGYAEQAMQGGDAPACPGASSAGAAPEPPAPTPVDFSQQFASYVAEERAILTPMIAGLKERSADMAAEVEKKQKAVEDLARKQEQAPDPQAKQQADDLLAEARKALAEAEEENRKAAEDLTDAEQRLQGLDLMAKTSAEAKPAAPAAGGAQPAPAKTPAN
jgi:hypothetical protein